MKKKYALSRILNVNCNLLYINNIELGKFKIVFVILDEKQHKIIK